VASASDRERIKRELGFDLVQGREYRLDDRQYTVTHHTPAKPAPPKQETTTILDYDYDGIY
jgi:hypothetical protein